MKNYFVIFSNYDERWVVECQASSSDELAIKLLEEVPVYALGYLDMVIEGSIASNEFVEELNKKLTKAAAGERKKEIEDLMSEIGEISEEGVV